MSWYPPSPYDPRKKYDPPPYFGFGSSNQVYSNSRPRTNQADDDGEDQPSRPYIPDSSNSVSFTAFGSTPNANGAVATDNVITLEPADNINPGGVSILAQTFAGNKTFTGTIEALSLTSDSFVNIPATSSSTVGVIEQAGTPIIHTFGTNNLFVGKNSGVFAAGGNGNVSLGPNNLPLLTTGQNNTSAGNGSLAALTTGSTNVAVGSAAGNAITTASGNVLVGVNSGVTLTTGNNNILVGPNTGSGLTIETNVVEVGNGTLKTPAQNDVIIGTSTSAQCYIGGVQGVAVGGTPQYVTINPATNQIGSQAIPASLSLGVIDSNPNANGAVLNSGVLQLEPASGSFGGVVTTGTQTLAGTKTFNNSINLVPTTALNVGCINSNGVQFMHSFGGLTNAFLGNSSGNFTLTATNCTGIGSSALTALTSGNNDVAVGYNSGKAVTTGVFNTFVGSGSGSGCTSGQNNVLIGTNAGAPIITGQGNTLIGNSAGFSSASTLSHALELSDGTFGTCVDGDIRIGTSASLKCYLGGIQNTTTLASKQMVVIDPTSHLMESMSLATTTWSSTATIDSGTINTMTVRGVSTTTIPLTLTLTGKKVTMTIPYFSLTGVSAPAHSISLSGAGFPSQFYPTYNMYQWIPVTNSGSTSLAICYVTSGGLVSIQLQAGGQFGLPMGTNPYDVHLTWNIV